LPEFAMSINSSDVSLSKKTSKSMIGCLKRSLNKNGQEIEILIETVAKIELFMIESKNYEPHIDYISEGKFTSLKSLNINNKRYMILVNKGYLLSEFYFDILREIGEAIRSMLIGNYHSISRSLRWIIESSVFFADMQSDNIIANESYQYYIEEIDFTKQNFDYLRSHIYNSKSELISERLFLKVKWKKYNLEDMINNKILSENIKFSKPKGYTLKENIKKLYNQFSGYEHISEESLSELYYTLRTDYALFMNYRYDEDNFQLALEDLWQVIDIILSIAILGGCFFYGYSNTKEFLGKIQKYYKKSSSTSDLITSIRSNNIQKYLKNTFLMI
jgi:hypothetical protein